jgi:hypothetical protein
MVTGRGIFDKETRRKALAFAGDALPVTFIWRLNGIFAVSSL